MATDSAARLHWEQAERCWLTMANLTAIILTITVIGIPVRLGACEARWARALANR
jgi:uncharacterized membrane protein YccF (DUF307 family)